jgi:hypothetical protein
MDDAPNEALVFMSSSRDGRNVSANGLCIHSAPRRQRRNYVLAVYVKRPSCKGRIRISQDEASYVVKVNHEHLQNFGEAKAVIAVAGIKRRANGTSRLAFLPRASSLGVITRLQSLCPPKLSQVFCHKSVRHKMVVSQNCRVTKKNVTKCPCHKNTLSQVFCHELSCHKMAVTNCPRTFCEDK